MRDNLPYDPTQAELDAVLRILHTKPTSVDDIVNALYQTTPVKVVGILTLLEMRGKCRRVPGNAFIRVDGT